MRTYASVAQKSESQPGLASCGLEQRYLLQHPSVHGWIGAKFGAPVERFAKANESSMSQAIAALVRIGLEGQELRKREFFKKLKENLTTADPSREDELVDEFRSLILGH